MNMAKAVKIYTGFTMDFTADRQAALREDGAVFHRVKGRGRWGYAWSRCGEPMRFPQTSMRHLPMTPMSACEPISTPTERRRFGFLID